MTRRTRQVGTLVLTAAAISVPRLEDRSRHDARRPRGREPRVVRARRRRSWSSRSRALALRWGWLLAAHGILERVPWLTRAVLRRVHGGPGAADVARRRRGARSSRRRGAIRDERRSSPATVLLERGARRRGDGALGAVGFVLSIGRVRRQRLPVARGRVRLRDARARLPLLRALGAAAAATDASRCSRGSGWSGRCGSSTRASTTTGAHPGCSRRCSPSTIRDAGGAHPRDLGGREGGRDRPRPAHLLRVRAAALPRHARAVHAERLRRAGGVLRQLPRQRRRRRRARRSPPASSSSSSRSLLAFPGA